MQNYSINYFYAYTSANFIVLCCNVMRQTNTKQCQIVKWKKNTKSFSNKKNNKTV